jgi:hypothetical protein
MRSMKMFLRTNQRKKEMKNQIMRLKRKVKLLDEAIEVDEEEEALIVMILVVVLLGPELNQHVLVKVEVTKGEMDLLQRMMILRKHSKKIKRKNLIN